MGIRDLPDWVQSDIAFSYRRDNPFPGWSAAQWEESRLARAITRVEDAYELSRSKAKQAMRLELKTLRRALEDSVDL